MARRERDAIGVEWGEEWEVKGYPLCYEIQCTWTARSTETETETGLDRYVMLGARWLTEY